MANKKLNKPILRTLKDLAGLFYQKLFRINDTAQKIALGLGIGVFAGIIPGTGPLASLFLAFLLRANRAAALLGSLLTNTWLSIATFLLAIKLGSGIMGVSWQGVRNDWLMLLQDFRWINLFKISVLKIILPVIAGYFLVAFCLAVAVYLITLVILVRIKNA